MKSMKDSENSDISKWIVCNTNIITGWNFRKHCGNIEFQVGKRVKKKSVDEKIGVKILNQKMDEKIPVGEKIWISKIAEKIDTPEKIVADNWHKIFQVGKWVKKWEPVKK